MKKLKAILTICLAGAFVASAAACEITVKPDPNDPNKDITIEVPDPNQNQTENEQGNQQGAQGGGQDSQSGQGSQSGEEQPKPQQPDYSQYSEMLQSILTSDYYNEIIDSYKTGKYHYNVNVSDNGYNKMEAIPYKFLERQGEDIESIKRDMIGVDAVSYTIENEKNSLYHRIMVQYEGQSTYAKQYFIKYDLSDFKEEFEELKMLYGGKYAQANFLFQEIDAHIEPKNVELISKFCIDKDTYKNLINSYNESKKIAPVFNSTVNDFIVLDGQWDRDVYIADVLLLSIDGNKTTNSGKIAKAKLNFDYVSNVTFENNIFKMKHFRNYTTQEITETTPITCYYQIFSSKDFAKTV